MKRFKFRLEAVSKVRRVEMEQQSRALALAFQKIALAQKELLDFEQLIQLEMARVQDLSDRGLFTDQLLRLSISYRAEIKRKMERKKLEIVELEKKAALEREKLIEKQKRKTALDKLEAKEIEKYDEENKDMERKQMDEMASARFAWTPGESEPSNQ